MFSQFCRNGYLINLFGHIDRLPVLIEVVIAALAHVHVLLELGVHLFIQRALDELGEKFVHLLAAGGNAQSRFECGNKFHLGMMGIVYCL